MIDPARLEQFYQQLNNAYELYFPDGRFGQFMMNFLGWLQQSVDYFFPDDDEMLSYIKQFSAGLDKPDVHLARGKNKHTKFLLLHAILLAQPYVAIFKL